MCSPFAFSGGPAAVTPEGTLVERSEAVVHTCRKHGPVATLLSAVRVVYDKESSGTIVLAAQGMMKTLTEAASLVRRPGFRRGSIV